MVKTNPATGAEDGRTLRGTGRRLQLKLFVAASVVLAIGLGSATALDVAAARTALTQQASEDALNSARVAWAAVRHLMSRGDAECIKPAFQDIVTRAGLTGLAIYPLDGTPFPRAAIRSGQVPSPPASGLTEVTPGDTRAASADVGTARAFTGADGEKRIRATLALRNEYACHRCHDARARVLGVLVADSSLARAEAMTASMARRAGLCAMLAFLLLGSTLAVLMRAFVQRPMALIEKSMAQVGAGHFTHRLALPGDDEFARLGQAFDQMTAQLSETTAHLESLAITDYLTSLPNHRYFQERLHEEVARAQRHGHPLALLMLDIDHFKLINDVHGHLAGDQVLHQVATVIKSCVRASDLVARYGGEEFAIILPEATAQEAGRLAERIRAAVEGHGFSVRRLPSVAHAYSAQVHLTATIGAAALPADSTEAEGLILAADAALLRAKRMSRNTVFAYGSLPEAQEVDHS